jgi:hypothetical protein
MPLGYALTGPIVDVAGSSATLVGVAIAAIGLSSVFILNRDLRELRIAGSPMVKEIGVPHA